MVSQVQGLWIQTNAETKLAIKDNVLEILKRAKSGGEIVAFNESEDNVREEVLKRNAKAGYCTRDGSPLGAGKGDRFRPVNKKKYDENYVKAFGHD